MVGIGPTGDLNDRRHDMEDKRYPADMVIKITLAIHAGVMAGASLFAILKVAGDIAREFGFELDSALKSFAQSYYGRAYWDHVQGRPLMTKYIQSRVGIGEAYHGQV